MNLLSRTSAEEVVPYLFKLQDGFLIGIEPVSRQLSPCSHCVELWLKQRQVFVERGDISELSVRRDLVGDLLAEGDIHVLYEISRTGSVTRLDSIIFPNPQCGCYAHGKYIPAKQVNKETHFAFSPIFQLKSARFSTPNGNLWLTSAAGEVGDSRELLSVYGAARDREDARAAAVDEWLKRQSLHGKPKFPETMSTLQFGEGVRPPWKPSEEMIDVCGVGKDEKEATLNGLFSLAKAKVIRGYASKMKTPMLVVGVNTWMRNQVPYFLLQQYDLYLFFYPNSMPTWVVGIAAFSRLTVNEKPVFVFGSHANIHTAIEGAIFKILELCRPDGGGTAETPEPSKAVRHVSKLNLWWTHWVYRCPKISLRDVLHLEPYSQDIEAWKSYFMDGELPVWMWPTVDATLPAAIRYRMRIRQPANEAQKLPQNVNGIGTWSSFQLQLI